MAENTDPVVLAQEFAPYTDPGVHGQTTLEGEKTFASVDEKAAGTPPLSGTHAGTNNGEGERYASVFTSQEERAELELDSRSTKTRETP